jgi:hypothetical protein
MPAMNAGAAEKISLVIKEHFVIVHVAMIKRNAKCARVAFQRPWREGRYQQSAGLKGHVHAGREVIARADDRTKIPDIQLGDPEVTLPGRDIHGIERVIHPGVVTVPLDAHFPFLATMGVFRRQRQFRRGEDSRIK